MYKPSCTKKFSPSRKGRGSNPDNLTWDELQLDDLHYFDNRVAISELKCFLLAIISRYRVELVPGIDNIVEIVALVNLPAPKGCEKAGSTLPIRLIHCNFVKSRCMATIMSLQRTKHAD
ncbi:hypothetical protein K437DRAFT_256438 [Tilletiaria anomala UBC 951]|uniref:Uncharacterized protein n=1 Tax=Tilletiaria anomala (strain ATCC 24038 / CBS 436.72 / UBC 951) TaxID=1037660 RepID=A0A066W4C9_TILAU|nr:uncharacterized protein K437DRAFT_256438 [Tilletiaria anomala UBC 951]KDN45919.1 hypothetical protein K437DRAFT_256438 [Tilletiaria anomala UBC 951]